jgi:threonine dehydrogenase-like Zn-dependent dehydrogenase
MDVYETDQLRNGVIDTTKAKGSLKEYQTVISVGDTVRSIKPGDVVCIDPTRYMVTRHADKSLRNGVMGDNMTIGYKFNTIKLDGKDCLMLYDQDITFVIEESEDVEDPTVQIIQPDKPSIIV